MDTIHEKCKQFSREPEGKRPLARLRKLKDNIKINLRGIWCGLNSSGSG
jgi:hypothetical protein